MSRGQAALARLFSTERSMSRNVIHEADCRERTWHACRFLSCSVLPVRAACNLQCPFCFSKSSVSALLHEGTDWRRLDLAGYFQFIRDRGATRLVITGGGEPLLRPDDVVYLIEAGARFFGEIACFTNGTYLTRTLSRRLADAGLSYLCYSRHHEDDEVNRRVMGRGAPSLAEFLAAAALLPVRATCVMAKGFVDNTAKVWRYMEALRRFGVRQFTFKHTYVAYEQSLFQGSAENRWAAQHQVEFDPFTGTGDVLGRLPWGPTVRSIGGVQVCYYHEPTPEWELAHRLCRSSNLLSDGSVYASLEDQRSLLYRLSAC
jgi:pyruvate-formate lyase-activating enzyme